MKSGIREDARTAKIVAAIAQGINTSGKLAAAFGTTIRNIAPELNRLADMKEIERGPRIAQRIGPPVIQWRVGPKKPPPVRGCKEPGCNRVYFARNYCRKHYAYHRYAVAAE